MAVTLSKETAKRINLSKETGRKVMEKKNLLGVSCRVTLVMDISGSMSNMLKNGLVQNVCERILSLAMNFTEKESADCFLFHNSSFLHPNPISLDNIEQFVDREILPNYTLGGTNYAPVINDVLKNYNLKPSKKPTGFLKKLFTGNEYDVVGRKLPTLVIFITDGDNMDQSQAKEAITVASYAPVFWQFVGIGSSSFSFLEELDNMEGRFVDNANFFQVNDIKRISDEELYDRLLTELPSYLQLARSKNLLY